MGTVSGYPPGRRSWLLFGLLLAAGLSLLGLIACGGEVAVGFPGCEDCPERCIKTSSGDGKCVPCIKDTQCQSDASPTRRCIDNKCACGTDKDCPADSVCSPENGCVECVKDEHCPKEKPYCVEKGCSICKPGAIQACSPDGLESCAKGQQTCRVNGRWGDCEGFVVCQDGEKCVKSKCVPECTEPAPCKSGEKICLTPPDTYPGRYKECVKDSADCDVIGAVEKYCGAKEVCSKGQCSPFSCPDPACKEGESRCVGESEYQLCGRNQGGCIVWLQSKPCASGEKCRAKVNKCTVCEPGSKEECYTGDPKLKGSGACKAGEKTCKDDGSGYSGCIGEVLPKVEVCDGKDNDCDGAVDEEFPTLGDPCEAGVGACKAKGKFVCKANALGVVCDAQGSGGKAEECNGIDDDCDGEVDNVKGTKDRITRACYNADPNTRGIGPCKAGTQTCKGAKWEPCVGAVIPTPELCDKIDNNCDGQVDNGGQEVCDGKDNNCDGQIDEGLTLVKYYPDTDNDGYGDVGGLAVEKCAAQKPTGYVDNNKDCDDGDRTVKPGVAETCDGIDNNCDGKVDEGLTTQNWYQDSDNDTYGKTTVAFKGCSKNTTTVCTGKGACRPNTGYVTRGGDCCDLDPLAKPGQTQYFYTANRCGSFDYNCDNKATTNVRTCACSKSARYTRQGTAYYYKDSTRYTWLNRSTQTLTYSNSTSCELALTTSLGPSGNKSLSRGGCCYSCKTVLGIKVSCDNWSCINESHCTASVTLYASRGNRSWTPRTSDNKRLVMWNKSTFNSACIYHTNGTTPKCGEEGYKANSLESSSYLRSSVSSTFYNSRTSCNGVCSFSYKATLSYNFTLDTANYSFSKPSSTRVKVLCR